jgi:hypothetical protein
LPQILPKIFLRPTNRVGRLSRMHKAKWPLKKGQILLNKAKFHFLEKSQKRAKSYQYFRLTLVRLSLLSRVREVQYVDGWKIQILKQILSFFGTDLCKDIATMLSLVSFSALRLAEFPEILLSVNRIRLCSVNDTQFLHSYMLLCCFTFFHNKLY